MAKTKEEELQTVTTTGNAVEKRIPNAKTALSIYKKLRENDGQAAINRSNIQKIYDGNPPYSKADMQRRGLSWMSNVDWGEFRSSINLNASAVWNMLIDVPVFIECKTGWKDAQNPYKDWGAILARAYSQVLREWDGFYFLMMMRIQETMKHGNGPVIWPDEEDWRSVNVKVSNLLTPATGSSDVSKLSMFCVRQEMDPMDLFRTIEDEDAAKDMGWNVAEVRKTMVAWYKNAAGTNDAYAISDWESLNQMVKNMDDASFMEFSDVRLVHLYSREKYIKGEPNSVTHQIIWENAEEQDVGFLYEKERRYESMKNALHNFLFTVGDGYMKSVRGLGREIFTASHASNRLINSMLTGVDMASGLMLQLDTGIAAESIQVTRKGPLYLIPAGVDAMQRQTMPSIEPTLGARKVINDIENNNAGIYKGKDEGVGPVRSATQIQKESFNEARFEGNQAVFYYVQITEWHKETFRRLINPDYPEGQPGYEGHARLIELLKDESFPMHLLKETWSTTAKRSIGLGSMSQKMAITNQMVSMKPGLSELGQNQVDRLWFAVRVGWENVDQFVPALDDGTELFMVFHAMAESENVDMMIGYERHVASDDPHGFHTTTHLQAIKATVDAFQQSQDPTKEFQTMQLLLQHVTQHVQMMAQDPANVGKAKQVMEILKQYNDVAGQMEAAAQEVMKARQKQQEEEQKKLQQAEEELANRDIEVKKHKIDVDAEVARYEIDKKQQAAVDKAIGAAQAKTIELEAKIENMFKETDAKIAAIERLSEAQASKTEESE